MSFSLFAFAYGSAENYRRDRLSEKRLWQAIQWALDHGCEVINITVLDEPPIPDVIHHVCRDPECPGGCE